jgi:RNA polymerase sigma factor (TIGR02999 family)
MMRAIAARELDRRGRDLSLQPTELLHEAYLQLAARERIVWRSREHFLAIAAMLMHRILVDHVRLRRRQKRGGGAVRVELPEDLTTNGHTNPDLMAVVEALARLERIEPTAARLVELRCLGGLTIDEAAQALGLARTTAVRRWQYVRGWLRDELEGT